MKVLSPRSGPFSQPILRVNRTISAVSALITAERSKVAVVCSLCELMVDCFLFLFLLLFDLTSTHNLYFEQKYEKYQNFFI